MKTLTTKYRDKTKYDYSCSEAILHAANDKYDLGLSEREFKMISPFSGGMLEGDVCGILTASISVIGILLTDGVSHNSPIMQEAVIEYKNKFKERFSSIDCRILVENKRKEDTGCSDFIIEASELLEEVVNKYVKFK